MHAEDTQTMVKAPTWFMILAGLGLLWSLGGLWQLYASVTADVQSLMAQGLSATAAQVMANPPIVLTLLFAINVLGGVVGCALLLAKKPIAVAVLIISFLAIVLYFVGAQLTGLLAAGGAALTWTLASVVLVSALLAWLGWAARNKGWLS